MKILFTTFLLASTAVTGLAQAADLPSRANPPAPLAPLAYRTAAHTTWSGIYGGLNAGWSFAEPKGTATPIGKFDGLMLGGVAGYNLQWGDVVLGVEADASWNHLSGSRKWTADDETITGWQRVSYLGTARGRLGYAYDRTMLYLTGGYAAGHLKMTLDNETTPFTGAASKWHHGYALGGGLEYAFSRNISVKAEYLYISLRTRKYFDQDITNSGLTTQAFRTGVNYRF